MIGLGIFLLTLAAADVVCDIVNIFYNSDEYEYTDYRRDRRTGCRTDYRTDEPERREQHGETR